MNEPLWSHSEGLLRAKELCDLFNEHPDALSPDEQALAQTLLTAIGRISELLRLNREMSPRPPTP